MTHIIILPLNKDSKYAFTNYLISSRRSRSVVGLAAKLSDSAKRNREYPTTYRSIPRGTNKEYTLYHNLSIQEVCSRNSDRHIEFCTIRRNQGDCFQPCVITVYMQFSRLLFVRTNDSILV